MQFVHQDFRNHEIEPCQASWKTLMYNEGNGHQACDITKVFGTHGPELSGFGLTLRC